MSIPPAAPMSGRSKRAAASTSTFPFEQWRYRYIPGIGNDVNIEFVDTTMSGEYHMTSDPSEKDALLYVPGAGLTMYEQMGLACKAVPLHPHRRNPPRHRQHAVACQHGPVHAAGAVRQPAEAAGDASSRI